jgi:hypothetical protein
MNAHETANSMTPKSDDPMYVWENTYPDSHYIWPFNVFGPLLLQWYIFGLHNNHYTPRLVHQCCSFIISHFSTLTYPTFERVSPFLNPLEWVQKNWGQNSRCFYFKATKLLESLEFYSWVGVYLGTTSGELPSFKICLDKNMHTWFRTWLPRIMDVLLFKLGPNYPWQPL